jgi:DNA-binding MarR family transcriptional regulator
MDVMMVRDRSNSVNSLSEEELLHEGLDPLFLVWLVARSAEELTNAVLAPVGLTADELAIYSVLASVTSITPTELARWTAAPPTTVSSHVKRLVERGHVERVPNEADRRSYRIALTPRGRAAHAAAAERFTPVRESVVAALDDADDVGRVLRRLRVVLDSARTSRDQRTAGDPGRAGRL